MVIDFTIDLYLKFLKDCNIDLLWTRDFYP